MEFKSFLKGQKPVVTMDFDHNLKFETGKPNKKIIKIFKELQKEYDVYIVTSRLDTLSNKREMEEFAREQGLKPKGILSSGGGKDKVSKVVELGAIAHYDDDDYELEKIEIYNKEHGTNIKTINTFNKDAWEEYVKSLDELEIDEEYENPSKKKKVFLGGTTNNTFWRSQLINLLNKDKVNWFNPVVSDWNEVAYQRELRERENSDYVLYVITPKMKGVYAIAEVVDDSNKQPEKTLFVVLQEDGGETFDEQQIKSLEAVKKMILKNGARYFGGLESCALFLNNL